MVLLVFPQNHLIRNGPILGGPTREFYDLVKPRLQASAFQSLIFQDWNEIRMVDNIHSSNESARLIGEAYAKVILDKLKQ